MAYTKDVTTGFTSVLPACARDKLYVLQKYVDFTDTDNALANAETMGIFDIPAGVLVREVGMWVITADADISDVDMGSYSTAGVAVGATTFVGSATIASTGWKRDVLGQTYSFDGTAGYISASDWSIGFSNNDAQTINEAKIMFFAICIDLREQAQLF